MRRKKYQNARDAWRKFTEIYGNPRGRFAPKLFINFVAAKNTVHGRTGRTTRTPRSTAVCPWAVGSSSTNSLTYPERYSRGGLQAGGDAGTWGSLGTTRVTARTAVAAPQRRSRRGRKPRIWQRKRLGVQKGGRQGKAWPCRISKPRTSRTALPSSKTRAGCRPPPPQPRDPHHPGSVRRLGKVQSAGWASRAKADLKIAAV